VLSGKVFEYLAAERPILAVVPPDGAAADLIREAGSGLVAAPEDVDAIRTALASLHERWENGSLNGAALPDDLRDRLDRRSRVREYADLLLNLPPSE
jgi:glycosyltransferase involved in cell wall biosynthesis